MVSLKFTLNQLITKNLYKNLKSKLNKMILIHNKILNNPLNRQKINNNNNNKINNRFKVNRNKIFIKSQKSLNMI